MKAWSRLLILVLVAGFCAAAAPSARAQEPYSVQNELARTDERIDRATQVIGISAVAEAKQFLENARTIQAQARTAYTNRQYRMALRLTLQARTFAERAIAVVRGLPDPERVNAQLERTREVIERARDRIADCALDRPRDLLQVASAMQGRAEDAGRNERYLAALQITMNARERALRALRLCSLEEDIKDQADRALHRTDEQLLRARDLLAARTNAPARQALDRAQQLEDEATREFRAGHYEPSLHLTQTARSFAERAMRLAVGTSS